MEKLLIWKEKKKQLHYTNQDIANKAELPLRTVEQIMCGKVKTPRLDTVQAIEKALGITTDFSAPAEILTDEEKKLINYFRVLNPSMRAYVLQMAKNAVLIKTVENEDKGAKNNEQQNG